MLCCLQLEGRCLHGVHRAGLGWGSVAQHQWIEVPALLPLQVYLYIKQRMQVVSGPGHPRLADSSAALVSWPVCLVLSCCAPRPLYQRDSLQACSSGCFAALHPAPVHLCGSASNAHAACLGAAGGQGAKDRASAGDLPVLPTQLHRYVGRGRVQL